MATPNPSRGRQHAPTPTKSIQVVPSYQQENSRFMQKLPQELRDEIYSHFFCSTRFCFGERAISRIGSRRIVSANRGKSLALLRTCRRIHDEIASKWLSQVLFHFEQPEALLNTLAPLGASIIGQIRHIRVSGNTLMISWGYDDVYYRTAQVLKLLPGLNLDRLTVMGMKHASLSYEVLSKLIYSSDGWKELLYVSHNSELLGFVGGLGPSDPLGLADHYIRKPQPGHWQSVLDERDGRRTKPSVVIYRSNSPTRGSVLDPDKRSVYRQQPSKEADLAEYGTQKDEHLMRPGEREKEILVVAKRGAGVDYAEKTPTLFLPDGDIREDSPAQTWKEIKEIEKEMSRFSDDDFDDYCEDDERDDENILTDEYRHVDEYTWPPFHFIKQ